MPSFDVVSEVNLVELRHAVENTQREIATRFDFRNVLAEVELNELTVHLKSESDFQVRQMEDIFRNQCVRRHVSTEGVEMEDAPVHSGRTFSLSLTFKQGIESAEAKKIIKIIKENKLKVQAAIQGDKIRVSGKKRDDLQACISVLKNSEQSLPLQFENFRD
ncbi:MAG: YajQ family cyclic di-GMP-binding protein [Legionellaceae bacterium]|nr:YajQ family cyclic di-GMP-binding protein [Legionellaceae bacterium]